MRGKFLGPSRSFAKPEWNTGRSSVRVFHQHPSRLAFYAADSPRRVAQKHDVAGIALYGEVFVERADDNAIRFGDCRKQRSLRNCAAAGDGSQPAAPTRAQLPVHSIMMDVCPV